MSRQIAIGLAHARAGHWDLAVLTLTGALEFNPNEVEIYRALGKVWLERPREDRAFLSKARRALERVASSPTATSELLTLYGRALLQDGDVDGAEHVLEQATLRFPIDPQALALIVDRRKASPLRNGTAGADCLRRADRQRCRVRTARRANRRPVPPPEH